MAGPTGIWDGPPQPVRSGLTAAEYEQMRDLERRHKNATDNRRRALHARGVPEDMAHVIAEHWQTIMALMAGGL